MTEEENLLSDSSRKMSYILDRDSRMLPSSVRELTSRTGTNHSFSEIHRTGTNQSVSEIHRSEKVTIELKCAFLKIVDIHTVEQIFQADVFIQAKWEDPAFSKFKKYPKFDPQLHWDPKLEILNTDQLTQDRKSYNIRHPRGSKHPVVTLLWRLKGVFRENMELRHFPFDVQDLTVQVSSERPAHSVQLIEDPCSISTVNTHTFDDAQEWSIYNHVECFHDRTTMEHASLTSHPILNFQARVKRKVGYFMWNIVLIMFMITALTFTAVGVEPSNGDRISISIMLFLTAVAFKLVVKQDLPTISYLTYLDIYILVLVIFLTAQSAHNACMCALGRTLTIMELRYWDQWIQIGLSSFLVVFHLVFIIYIQFTAMRRRRIMVEKDKQYERKRQYSDKYGSTMASGTYSESALRRK